MQPASERGRHLQCIIMLMHLSTMNSSTMSFFLRKMKKLRYLSGCVLCLKGQPGMRFKKRITVFPSFSLAPDACS